ncbi:MAG: hypothetical protein QXH27_01975 [Candidatus Micrarchaeia archaeon]
MRAQTAMEYLITYGWAILILGVLLVLMFNLGFFNPGSFVTGRNQAFGLGTFALYDFKVVPNGNITLYLINNAGARVTITSIAVKGANLTGLSPALPQSVDPGGQLNITGQSVMTGSVGDTFTNVKLEIRFDLQGGAAGHVDAGILQGRIDPA